MVNYIFASVTGANCSRSGTFGEGPFDPQPIPF